MPKSPASAATSATEARSILAISPTGSARPSSKPGVYTPDTDFIASLFGDREVLDPYTKTAITAQAGVNHLFSEKLSARLFLYGSLARFDDDFGRRDFTTVGIPGGLTYDNRDNPADATEGFFLDGRRALLRIQLWQCRSAHDCRGPHLLRLRQ